MPEISAVEFFQGNNIRYIWDDELENTFFSNRR